MHTFKVPSFITDQVNEHLAEKTITSNTYGDNTSEDLNYTGLVGEHFINLLYGNEMKQVDYGTDITLLDLSVDIKTQTFYTGKPTSDWWLNFSARQVQHMTDDYLLFNLFNPKTNKLHLMGWIERLEFLDVATFIKKGDPLPNRTKNPATVDTYMIQGSGLLPMHAHNFMPHPSLSKHITITN